MQAVLSMGCHWLQVVLSVGGERSLVAGRAICSQVAGVLKELVLSADGVTKIMEIFTAQMDLANSAEETKRKQSDLLMENTHVRLLMDGTGPYLLA